MPALPPVLARGHQPALPDAFPDPPGSDPLGTGIVINVPNHVGGRGRVELWHQVPVVGDEVAADSGEVLHGGRQVQLHPRENVQQRLLRGEGEAELGQNIPWNGSGQTTTASASSHPAVGACQLTVPFFRCPPSRTLFSSPLVSPRISEGIQ